MLNFAQEIAQLDMQGGFRGIETNAVKEWAREWAELVWESPEELENRDRFEFQMSQIALFAQGAEGRLRFVQEILEQYLIGRLYVDYLHKNEIPRFIDEFDHWQFPENSITLEMLAEHCKQQVSRNPMQSFIQPIVFQSINKPTAFKNMLQLLSVAGINGRFLGNNIMNKDLSGVKLRNMDLRGVSFLGCNLTNTEFHACDLQEADFTGATLSNTGFLQMDSHLMDKANFGDTNRLHSLRVTRDGTDNLISDLKEARLWLTENTNLDTGEAMSGLPCPASEQLRHLFGKYINPDGTGRRDSLREDAINRGTRYIPRPEEALRVAVSYGCLTKDRLNRYQRPDGDRYSEMVEFVKAFEASDVICFMLDQICDVKGCRHVSP